MDCIDSSHLTPLPKYLLQFPTLALETGTVSHILYKHDILHPDKYWTSGEFMAER